MKRVVITGYGIISALGNNVDTFWKNIAEGKSGIKLIEDPEFSDIPTRIAAYIESFDAEKYMNKIDKVEITGFWGNREININFFSDVNFFIGQFFNEQVGYTCFFHCCFCVGFISHTVDIVCRSTDEFNSV